MHLLLFVSPTLGCQRRKAGMRAVGLLGVVGRRLVLSRASSAAVTMRPTADLQEELYKDPGPPATMDDIPIPFKPYKVPQPRKPC